MSRERKYALSKIAAGDYLLPSNDGLTIWRVRRYMDGPSRGLEDWPADRTFWGLWRWDGSVEDGAYADPDDWSQWEWCESLLATRSAAIGAALDMGPE